LPAFCPFCAYLLWLFVPRFLVSPTTHRGSGLWDEVCSPKMQWWSLLALADLYVINRPHTHIGPAIINHNMHARSSMHTACTRTYANNRNITCLPSPDRPGRQLLLSCIRE